MSGLKFVWFAFRHHTLSHRANRGLIGLSSGYRCLKYRTNYVSVGSLGKNVHLRTKESLACPLKPLPTSRKRYSIMIWVEKEKNKALVKVTSKGVQRALTPAKAKCSSIMAYSEKGRSKVLITINSTKTDQSDISPSPTNHRVRTGSRASDCKAVSLFREKVMCKAVNPYSDKEINKALIKVDSPAKMGQNFGRTSDDSLAACISTKILEKSRANVGSQGDECKAVNPYSEKEINKALIKVDSPAKMEQNFGQTSDDSLAACISTKILEKSRANFGSQGDECKSINPYNEKEIIKALIKLESLYEEEENAHRKTDESARNLENKRANSEVLGGERKVIGLYPNKVIRQEFIEVVSSNKVRTETMAMHPNTRIFGKIPLFTQRQGSVYKAIDPYSEKVINKALNEIDSPAKIEQSVRHSYRETVAEYFRNNIRGKQRANAESQTSDYKGLKPCCGKVTSNASIAIPRPANAEHTSRHTCGESVYEYFNNRVLEKNRTSSGSKSIECTAIKPVQENGKASIEVMNKPRVEEPTLRTRVSPLTGYFSTKGLSTVGNHNANMCHPTSIENKVFIEVLNPANVKKPVAHTSGETVAAYFKANRPAKIRTKPNSHIKELNSIAPSPEEVNRKILFENVSSAKDKLHALRTRAEAFDALFSSRNLPQDRGNFRSHRSKCNTTTANAEKVVNKALVEVVNHAIAEQPAFRKRGETLTGYFGTKGSANESVVSSQERVNNKALIDAVSRAMTEQSSLCPSIETSAQQFNRSGFVKYPRGSFGKSSATTPCLEKGSSKASIEANQSSPGKITESLDDYFEPKNLLKYHATAESQAAKFNVFVPYPKKEMSKALIVVANPNKVDQTDLRKSVETWAACWNHLVTVKNPIEPDQEKEKNKELAKVEAKNKPEEDIFGNDTDLSLIAKFKLMCRKYWYVFIPVHVVTSVGWLGGLYLLTKSGIDIPAILAHLHISEAYVVRVQSSNMGYWALAYLVYHIVSPLRYAATLGGTKYLIKYLTRKGISFKRVPTRDDVLQWLKKADRKSTKKGKNDSA